jgi:hypothetical protein
MVSAAKISLGRRWYHFGDGTSVEAELVGDAVEDVSKESEGVRHRRTSHAQDQEGYENFRFHVQAPIALPSGGLHALMPFLNPCLEDR